MFRLTFKLLFISYIFLLVALNNLFFFGLPVRTLLLLILSGIVLLYNRKVYLELFSLGVFVFLLILYVSFVSQFNTVLTPDGTLVVRLIQTYLMVVVCYFAIIEYGAKFYLNVLIFFALVTSIVGVAQFFDIPGAWGIRLFLQTIQTVPADSAIHSFMENQTRAPGLTLFAVHQGYFLLSVLICMLLYIQVKGVGLNFTKLVLIFIIVMGIYASELRSAFWMGLVCLIYFMTVGLQLKYRVIFLVIVFCFSPLLLFTGLLDLGSDSRLLTVDKSAIDKLPLTLYGLDLFISNPIGWGSGFNSIELANRGYSTDNIIFVSQAPYTIPLHNATLNYLNIYGLFGMTLLLLFYLKLFRVNRLMFPMVTFFVINTLTHNAGIFQNDLFSILFISMLLAFDNRDFQPE